MAEFPEIPDRPPAAWHEFATKLKAWCIEHSLELVVAGTGDPKLERFPSGIKLTVGSGTGGTGTGTEDYYVVINGAVYTQAFLVNGEPELVP